MDPVSLFSQTATQQAQNAYADSLAAQAQNARKAAGRQPDMTKVKAAAQQFEGFFVGQMMEYMMADLHPDATFGGGQAEETWRSMLNQEYGKEIAKSGKLGIADWVMKSMLQAQAQKTASSSPSMPTAVSDNGTTVMPGAIVAAGAAKASKLDVRA